MASSTINLKLLVDAKSNKVVYAEAKKDFVDFLFGLLELPIGTVLSLLVNRGKSGPGSLAKIHASVKTLDDDYLQSDRTRNSLLSPTIVDDPNKSDKANPTPLLKQLAYPQQNSLYSSYSYSSSSRKDVVEGHVKGVVTYMVMDDLTVKPMSTISSISILNNMRVKDFGSLDEKNVVVDMNKFWFLNILFELLVVGLELLKASFESTTVLSDVFLPAVQFPSTSGKRGRSSGYLHLDSGHYTQSYGIKVHQYIECLKEAFEARSNVSAAECRVDLSQEA
ncbi:hypothetical protein RHGRI_036382 [Rhododendron griersonianum]|uniref:Uncharacterized protein n=1 Tax=Rhododendron griersonianum TaxID=479676 RepID=A0AAV6HTE6_9ERIC|nr:hypothetical protein RHGRI_036382 [Rhododendron griersonianum]